MERKEFLESSRQGVRRRGDYPAIGGIPPLSLLEVAPLYGSVFGLPRGKDEDEDDGPPYVPEVDGADYSGAEQHLCKRDSPECGADIG